ncbi:MAG: LytTR family DNA-binding domain-containing protein [Bacteroides sp.]|nr:LytTR family DNA-binding domain-containing protein [Bacteroides sp.]
MNCIIVDDEPLAREVVHFLTEDIPGITLAGSFNSAIAASQYMLGHPVDLIFLDIQMPGITGIEFTRTIPKETLIIFTTAYSEYALDNYEVDAIDYLIKPVDPERFGKAVTKAQAYHEMLLQGEKEKIEKGESLQAGHFFVKSERRFFKVNYDDILFIEGLKDYVILQLPEQRIITKMNLKNIHDLLPQKQFLRVNKSYIVNSNHINSFDNNDIFIGPHKIGIGSSYRDHFFEEFVTKNRM